MEAKKILKYVDSMKLEVVGTEPKPEKPGVTYDPIYDRMTERAPSQGGESLSNYTKKFLIDYGKSPDMGYGGRPKRAPENEHDWNYS